MKVALQNNSKPLASIVMWPFTHTAGLLQHRFLKRGSMQEEAKQVQQVPFKPLIPNVLRSFKGS
jgi:hypothetical protein